MASGGIGGGVGGGTEGFPLYPSPTPKKKESMDTREDSPSMDTSSFEGAPEAPPLDIPAPPEAPPFDAPAFDAPVSEPKRGAKRKEPEVQIGERPQKIQRGASSLSVSKEKIKEAGVEGSSSVSAPSIDTSKSRKLIKPKKALPQTVAISNFEKAEKALKKVLNQDPSKKILKHTFLSQGLHASKLAEKGIQEMINAISKEPNQTNREKLNSRLFEYQTALLTLQSSMRQLYETPSKQRGHEQLQLEARTEVQKMQDARPGLAVRFFAANHKWLSEAQDAYVESMKGKGGGVSGASKVTDDKGAPLAIAKQATEAEIGATAFEDFALKRSGGQLVREAGASLYSEVSGLAVVPPTHFAHIKSDVFSETGAGAREQIVSEQTWARDAQEIAHLGRGAPLFDAYQEKILTSSDLRDPEFVGSLDDRQKYPFDIKGEVREYTGAQIKEMVKKGKASFLEKIKTMPLEQAQSHMMHSVLIGALDEENEDNTMMMMQPIYNAHTHSLESRPIAIKIDNGLSMPTLSAKDWCPKFCWYDWPQSRMPLCPETALKIKNQDVFRTIESLDRMYQEAQRSAGAQGKFIYLEPGSYYFLVASDMASKLGAQLKLSPYEIAETMKTFITYATKLMQQVEKQSPAEATLSQKLHLFQRECETKLKELFAARAKRASART